MLDIYEIVDANNRQAARELVARNAKRRTYSGTLSEYQRARLEPQDSPEKIRRRLQWRRHKAAQKDAFWAERE